MTDLNPPYRDVELKYATPGADEATINKVADYLLDQPTEGMPITIKVAQNYKSITFAVGIESPSLLNAASQVECRIRGHLSMLPATLHWRLRKLTVRADD